MLNLRSESHLKALARQAKAAYKQQKYLSEANLTSKTNINNDYTCAVINKNQILLFASWLQFIPFHDKIFIKHCTCTFLQLITYTSDEL